MEWLASLRYLPRFYHLWRSLVCCELKSHSLVSNLFVCISSRLVIISEIVCSASLVLLKLSVLLFISCNVSSRTVANCFVLQVPFLLLCFAVALRPQYLCPLVGPKVLAVRASTSRLAVHSWLCSLTSLSFVLYIDHCLVSPVLVFSRTSKASPPFHTRGTPNCFHGGWTRFPAALPFDSHQQLSHTWNFPSFTFLLLMCCSGSSGQSISTSGGSISSSHDFAVSYAKVVEGLAWLWYSFVHY